MGAGAAATSNVKLLRPDAHGIMLNLFRRFGGDQETGTLTSAGFASMLVECGIEPAAVVAIGSSGVFQVRAISARAAVSLFFLSPPTIFLSLPHIRTLLLLFVAKHAHLPRQICCYYTHPPPASSRSASAASRRRCKAYPTPRAAPPLACRSASSRRCSPTPR